MDGFTFQSHSVYRDKVSGALLLLVHHNPMALCSLLLDGKDGSFDVVHPRKAGVDAIIAMRQSGSFEELPPLAEKDFLALLTALLPHVSPDERPFIQALIESAPEK